jgi:SAM-dependent methyltransferase
MAGIIERITGYIELPYLMSISIFYLPLTLLTHPLLAISSPSSFRSKWFENFWLVIGPKMAASPLQVDHIEDLMSRAHGTILELGPGGGDQMFHFKPSNIKRVYGAEPNAFLHPELLKKATENGLGAKYTALEAGAQPGNLLPALKKAGLLSPTAASLPEDGIFDSIVAVKCLCSVPQRQLPSTIAVIQALLKPGGEFLFFEHLGNNSDRITQSYAWMADWIWPIIMGGCHLDGKLDDVVLRMGGWEERNLTTTGEYKGYEIFRYVKGICKKAA